MTATEEAVRQAAVGACPAAAGELADFLADTAASVFEDEADSVESFREALEGALGPYLEEFSVEAGDATSFYDAIVDAAFGRSGGDSSGSTSKATPDNTSPSGADLLCRLPNLLMMYGGSNQPLLRNATLELIRGHRYGVVGANGSGKSTLMGRIVARDIAGFPQSIRVAHLSHDKIAQGVTPSMTSLEYARSNAGAPGETDNGDHLVEGSPLWSALQAVGFDNDLLQKSVDKLSGGWQMRLMLACAVAQEANLLILDEPTNHLDSDAVSWLVDFINATCIGGKAGVTAMIVSHDPDFLDKVCTDIVHFTQDAKLTYFPGNFSLFKEEVLKGDQAQADSVLGITSSIGDADGDVRMIFPAPERIGATSAARKAPVITLQGVTFQYEGASDPVLRDVNVQLTMESRVGIVGKNGSGKSTLMALLAGRLKPSPDLGERWCNKSARVAYIAQQHLVHLKDVMSSTPLEYIQARYALGFDAEAPEPEQRKLTEKEEADRKRLGIMFGKKSKPVQALVGRREQVRLGTATADAGPKTFQYKVQWEGLADVEMTWEGRGKLLQCGCEAMVNNFDDRLYEAWAGVDQRPLTTEEIVDHLAPFGLPEDVVRNRKIAALSSGQKIKLMFGAALWTRSHILCLDEPTNFLDVESVDLLAEALTNFKGAYAIVTHNDDFAERVCSETWTVAEGQVLGAKTRFKPKARGKAKV